MWNTIGQLLPSAVGVALSPVPIVAVILMLGTPKAKSNGPAFAAGWILGLVAVSVVVLLLASGADDPDSGTSTAVDWIKLVLGLVLLVLAYRRWHERPRPGAVAEMPKWMAAIDSFTPGRSFGLGALLAGVNPKNLALTMAASATIARAGLGGAETAGAVALFVILGSITVAGPVIFSLVMSERAAGPLASMKEFMSAHNGVIMMVVLIVLGAKLIGDAISGLSI